MAFSIFSLRTKNYLIKYGTSSCIETIFSSESALDEVRIFGNVGLHVGLVNRNFNDVQVNFVVFTQSKVETRLVSVVLLSTDFYAGHVELNEAKEVYKELTIKSSYILLFGKSIVCSV